MKCLPGYKKLEVTYLTLSQLTTLIRKNTKKVGSYIELYSGPLHYNRKSILGSRVRKIKRVSNDKYSCSVKYTHNNKKRTTFTSYDTSCFMKQYSDNYRACDIVHSLKKTMYYLYDHDICDGQLYPFRIKIKNKTYQIFVKEFMERHN